MPNGYSVICKEHAIDGANVHFLRVKVTDYKLTLQDLLVGLLDTSWIDKIARDWLKITLEARYKGTMEKIIENFKNTTNPNLQHDTAEKLVSESSRKAVVSEFNYADIPLAELFKQKDDGNPGFDFYTENTRDLYILFGEAKYVNGKNAYENALSQIEKFTGNNKLEKDILDLQNFCNEISLNKAANKECGFMAAFSCTAISTDILKANFMKNAHYKVLKKYKELILIAVEI